MSNDNTETKADGGESSLTGGLEVTVAMMTNTEIASAIAYAFDRCDQRLVGGYTTSNTEPGKAMLEHLKKLLAIQYDRARMVTTSNVEHDRRPAASSQGVRVDGPVGPHTKE